MKSVNLASNSSKNSKDASNSFCLFPLLCKPSCLPSLINQSWSKNSKNEIVFSKLLLHEHLLISHILEDEFELLLFNADYCLSNSINNVLNQVILSYCKNKTISTRLSQQYCHHIVNVLL